MRAYSEIASPNVSLTVSVQGLSDLMRVRSKPLKLPTALRCVTVWSKPFMSTMPQFAWLS